MESAGMHLIEHRKPVIFSDFDGTITERDVIMMIMERFAPPVWRSIVDDIMKTRTLSIRDGVSQLFELIPGTKKDEIVSFVMENVRFRAGFPEFLDFCQEHQIPFLVVSGGVDFFIEPILAPYRDKLTIFCNSAEFHAEHIELIMPFYNENCQPCGQCACCKLSILDRYPQNSHYRIAIGDSITDLAMAQTADWTFARHHLKRYLDEVHCTYTSYESFTEIQTQLSQKLLLPA